MKLDVRELPEAGSAHLALIRLLSRVDQEVFAVVGMDSEGFSAVLTLMWLLSGVLQFVRFQRLEDDE